MSIANELITRGWTHGALMEDDGSVCLVGAAACAYGIEFYHLNSHGEIWHDMGTGSTFLALPLRVQNALYSATGGKPCGFNDASGRTFDEVLRVAKEADEILDSRV